MQILRNSRALSDAILAVTPSRKPIGFVPTMGALHEGHLTLVKAAKLQAKTVVVSIFVNPTQFGPNEDFSRYPRREEEDAALLKGAGVDFLYLPHVSDIYPKIPRAMADFTDENLRLCGIFRPGHFNGVATVVKTLFEQVTPEIAFFGEKDFQQLWVIRKLVSKFNLPVEIVGVPTVREETGLALSSRNEYLSPAERAVAISLYAIMQGFRNQLIEQNISLASIPEIGRKSLLEAGFNQVDYFEIRNSETLQLLQHPEERPARIFAAAWLGKTRLIDNLPL